MGTWARRNSCLLSLASFWACWAGCSSFKIFKGEAGSVAADGEHVTKYVKSAFLTMRFIVSVGWSIYPLGYFFGYLLGSVDDASLNMVYNLADFVNKIGFCLAIWHSAKQSTLAGKEHALLG